MGIVTVAEELRTSYWWLAGISSRCFSIRLNLPGVKNLLFGSSAAFAFGKAGEVLTVSFLHKFLLPFLEQSGPSASLSPPRVCSCYGGMCVYVFFCLQQKCSTSTMEFFAVSIEWYFKKKWFCRTRYADRLLSLVLLLSVGFLFSWLDEHFSFRQKLFFLFWALSIETWRVAGLQQQKGCAWGEVVYWEL